LYIEHQEYKYRNLSWVSVPVTVGLVAAVWTLYDTGYRLLTDGLEKGIQSLIANGMLPSVFSSTSAASLSGSVAFELILLAVLTLLLLSYMIALMDTIFLKWMW
jgi:hypothetical protein